MKFSAMEEEGRKGEQIQKKVANGAKSYIII